MIGIYDYTVWLTYLSLISAGLGIIVSLNGTGHPYYGTFFLLVCGLCDAFDGKVARTKKNRTEMEKNFGVQIDSLADLVAFGVLPACIGNAMVRVSPTLPDMPKFKGLKLIDNKVAVVFFIVILFYILAALIRLAYFNVTEEERQKKEGGVRKYYEGLPVTTAALIFPTVLLIQYLSPADMTPLYFVVMVLTAFAFIGKFKVPKAGTRGIMLMMLVGLIEFVIMLVSVIWKLRG